MQTWVTLAAKHATLAAGIGLGTVPAMGWDSLDGVAVGFLLAGAGYAAVNSSRQLRSCPLPPPGPAGSRAASGGQGTGALTRIRRRVDGVLTSMLKDDMEHPATQLRALAAVPSVAEPRVVDPGTARSQWDKDYVDAIVGPAEGGRTAVTTAPPPRATERPERPERVGEWPYLTVVRDSEFVQDAAARWSFGPAGGAKSDLAFWGPKSPRAASGRSEEHRADQTIRPSGPVREHSRPAGGLDVSGQDAAHRSADGRRPAPRHAAPPAGFGVILGRRLTSPRFTSRSAAHAG
jgi:hypothetical protein